MGKPTMLFPTRSDTNRAVQEQKRARSLKFRIYVEEELYYPSSENKGADQLRSYCEVDLPICFRQGRLLVFPCGGSNSYHWLLRKSTFHPGIRVHLGPKVIKLIACSAQLRVIFKLLLNNETTNIDN